MSHTPARLVSGLQTSAISDAGALLRTLRKRKDSDEIAEIQRSLSFSKAAYEAARASIQPGASEMDVRNAMLDAATQHAGHPITFTGDFAGGLRCVRGGGPPFSSGA